MKRSMKKHSLRILLLGLGLGLGLVIGRIDPSPVSASPDQQGLVEQVVNVCLSSNGVTNPTNGQCPQGTAEVYLLTPIGVQALQAVEQQTLQNQENIQQLNNNTGIVVDALIPLVEGINTSTGLFLQLVGPMD